MSTNKLAFLLAVLDHAGTTVFERDLPASPDAFRNAIAPFRAGLVVGLECMFAWYCPPICASRSSTSNGTHVRIAIDRYQQSTILAIHLSNGLLIPSGRLWLNVCWTRPRSRW